LKDLFKIFSEQKIQKTFENVCSTLYNPFSNIDFSRSKNTCLRSIHTSNFVLRFFITFLHSDHLTLWYENMAACQNGVYSCNTLAKFFWWKKSLLAIALLINLLALAIFFGKVHPQYGLLTIRPDEVVNEI